MKEEAEISQRIAQLCSDPDHSMPVLPPDDFEAAWSEANDDFDSLMGLTQ